MNLLRPLLPALRTAADLLYPPACVGCGIPLPHGEYLCEPCAENTPRVEPPFCQVCSQHFEGEIPDAATFICGDCRAQRFAFACAVNGRRHDGLARTLVVRFKYEHEYFLRQPLAAWLAEAFDTDPRLHRPAVDALVPVPLHPRRERERTFNQATVLARLLGRRVGLPVWTALRRVRFTEVQATLTRPERLENLRGAFAPVRRRPVTGANLLLIDDVFTTGSTVDECARVLCRAGAASVRVLTVTRR